MDNFDDFATAGDAIKFIRQQKGISHEELIDKTSVSSSFIIDLEKGHYGNLPPVAYTIGLIENLLESMKVDRKDIDTLLERAEREIRGGGAKGSSLPQAKPIEKKKDEKEKPTTSDDKKNIQFLIWIGVASIIFLLLLFYVFFEIRKASEGRRTLTLLEDDQEKDEKITYSLYERFDTLNLKAGNRVRIFLNGDVVDFVLRKVDSQVISFDLGAIQGGTLSIRKEILVDIDEDSIKDISIKYQKNSDQQALVYFEMLRSREDDVDYEQIWKDQEPIKVGKSYTLIRNSNRFLIEVFIKATTLPVFLSYNVDGKRQNTITLESGGQIIITAENHLEIQVGNYRSAIFVLNRQPISFFLENSTKFSITKIIKWLPGTYNETKNDLVIQDYTE